MSALAYKCQSKWLASVPTIISYAIDKQALVTEAMPVTILASKNVYTSQQAST